jgi:DNA-binding response OmpR family regulator
MDLAPRVLIVSADRSKRDEIGRCLEAEGYDVTTCPGPLAPRYVCVGARLNRCPLVETADVAVVDGWLASDEVRSGVPSWHLARMYWGAGLPVVFLVGPDGLPAGVTNDRLVAVARSSDPHIIAGLTDALRRGTTAA